MTDFVDARNDYHARGFKCVPLTDGKTPTGFAKWQDRDFDAAEFAKPKVNGVGVQLGPKSGIIDIEWDTPAQCLKGVELCGAVPDGPEFRSKSGGHKLFAWDERLEACGCATVDFECADGSFLKIRIGAGGKGAQSAFPPSPNKTWLPGKSLDDLAVPKAPESLIAALLDASAAKRQCGDPGEWLDHEFPVVLIESCRDALAALPDAVSGENGQGRMMGAMRVIRQHVGNYGQALELAEWFNANKCDPPFDAAEVERKLNQSNEPIRSHPDDDFSPIPPWVGMPGAKAFPYKFYSAAELASADFKVEFLIDRAMVAGQPMLIGGPSKSLKTSLMLDAAVALACGGQWLGTFDVLRQCSVVVMSGESGLPVLRDTLEAQCRRRGFSLATLADTLNVSGDLPEFGDDLHAEAVRQVLEWFRADVLVIDPLYLALPGEDAANAQVQGRLIKTIARVCEKLNVVLVIAGHTKKLEHNQPITLNEIAYSAGPQFAGQWWLVNRRERFVEGSGEHKLWLSIGGRAKFSSAWGVDVVETPASEFGEPERWEVSTFPATDAKVVDRQRLGDAKLNEDLEAIREAMNVNGTFPTFSKNAIAKAAGVHTDRVEERLLHLIAAGEVIAGAPTHHTAKASYRLNPEVVSVSPPVSPDDSGDSGLLLSPPPAPLRGRRQNRRQQHQSHTPGAA